jgi:hypothetical protein
VPDTEPFEMIPQEYDAAVPIEKLQFHPDNPNEGDVGFLCTVLDSNGFGGAVLAQKSTGILIDGETRVRAAMAKGNKTLPVFWLDVDDEKRDYLLAEYNEATRRGRNDESKLLALLTRLASTPRGLDGAGFDGDDVEDLRQMLNAPDLQGLGGSGGGAESDDLWPVLRFKVPPDVRDKFYEITDAAEDQTNEGRFYWMIEQAIAHESCT